MYDIQLTNNAFEGANSVYLLGVEDDGPTTLVDTGVSLPTIRDELAGHLHEAGVEFADVERVLLTHWHHDHAGLASEIQAAGAATVYVHEADAPLVANEPGAMAAIETTQERCLEEWAMPEPKREELLAFLERHDDLRGGPVDVTTLADGDHVRAGPYDLDVVHLPGHAAGLVAYAFERDGRREAFVGDAILPKYTPNVGGADVRVDRPLANYLASLERIQSLDLDRAWPGHRGPIIAPSARAQDIAVHHEERTERVMAALREHGPATAWEVSDALFGHLETIHILHGPGEAYAHLDHLVHQGVVAESDGQYELVDDTRAASDVLAAEGPR